MCASLAVTWSLLTGSVTPIRVSHFRGAVQNNNKSDTLIFHDPTTGEQFTASRLAKKQKITASAIRKRVERGWSDASIIAGKQVPHVSIPPVPEPTKSPSPDNIPCPVGTWYTAMMETYPGQFLDLTAKEKGMLDRIAKRCYCAGFKDHHVVEMFDYTIRNW